MNVGDVSPNKNVHVFRSERAVRPDSAFSHSPAMDVSLPGTHSTLLCLNPK